MTILYVIEVYAVSANYAQRVYLIKFFIGKFMALNVLSTPVLINSRFPDADIYMDNLQELQSAGNYIRRSPIDKAKTLALLGRGKIQLMPCRTKPDR